MKFVSTVLALGSGLVLAGQSSNAFADDYADTLDGNVPAVSHAFEVGIGGGYAQASGDIGDGMSSIGDLAGGGGAVELQLGYRVLPQLTVGVYGSFASYAEGEQIENPSDVFGASAGVRADWHLLPHEDMDPWISLSSGWRGMWLSPDAGGDTSLQGFELARLQVGVDYRITPDVAIAPVVGAGLSLYAWQDAPASDGYQDIDDPQANFNVFAGLMGRFDLGGSRAK
jgi:hypothetical protein